MDAAVEHAGPTDSTRARLRPLILVEANRTRTSSLPTSLETEVPFSRIPTLSTPARIVHRPTNSTQVQSPPATPRLASLKLPPSPLQYHLPFRPLGAEEADPARGHARRLSSERLNNQQRKSAKNSAAHPLSSSASDNFPDIPELPELESTTSKSSPKSSRISSGSRTSNTTLSTMRFGSVDSRGSNGTFGPSSPNSAASLNNVTQTLHLRVSLDSCIGSVVDQRSITDQSIDEIDHAEIVRSTRRTISISIPAVLATVAPRSRFGGERRPLDRTFSSRSAPDVSDATDAHHSTRADAFPKRELAKSDQPTRPSLTLAQPARDRALSSPPRLDAVPLTPLSPPPLPPQSSARRSIQANAPNSSSRRSNIPRRAAPPPKIDTTPSEGNIRADMNRPATSTAFSSIVHTNASMSFPFPSKDAQDDGAPFQAVSHTTMAYALNQTSAMVLSPSQTPNLTPTSTTAPSFHTTPSLHTIPEAPHPFSTVATVNAHAVPETSYYRRGSASTFGTTASSVHASLLGGGRMRSGSGNSSMTGGVGVATSSGCGTVGAGPDGLAVGGGVRERVARRKGSKLRRVVVGMVGKIFERRASSSTIV